jgi:glycerophosphoryl diester phosphodiesterase
MWTVNDEANMTRFLALGVEGIMTDRAGLLKKVLKAKGLWVN